MYFTTHGHVAFLHGFQQSSLGLGRCRADLIGQDDVGEERTFQEFEVTVFVQDLRTGDVPA